MNEEIMSIIDENDFNQEMEWVNNIINPQYSSLSGSFRLKYPYFFFLDFDQIARVDFYKALHLFCKEEGESEYKLGIIDPAPKSYYKNFGRFPFLRINTATNEDMIVKVMSDGPENSPADAFLCIVNKALIYSASSSWAILFDRNTEVAVFVLENELLRELCEKSFNSIGLFSDQNVIENLIDVDQIKDELLELIKSLKV